MKEKWENYWKDKKVKVSSNKKRVIEILDRYAHKNKVLDAGCGSGFFSNYFAKKGCKVISLDYSKEALKLTRHLYPKIRIIKGDMLHAPFKNESFDLIFSDGLLEHYKNPIPILTKFGKILKLKGIIATFVPNKFSYWILIKPFKFKEIEEFRFSLKKLIELHEKIGFKVIESGGIGVFPSDVSPEFLGKYIGRIIYSIVERTN
jgi:SAM-dependent methyltransferase